jgi:sugar lactone lactonase YvrE
VYLASFLSRFDPRSGDQLQQVILPVSRVTSCCWGGEALDVLYVTTARVGLSSEKLKNEPHAGGLFAIKNLGIKGTPTFAFAG